MLANLDGIESLLRWAGKVAKERQAEVGFSLKEDGSPVTPVDVYLSDKITSYLKDNYPECNIISEETETGSWDPDAPFTFLLDPIDGTASYTQGFPAWCVALGILDKERQPVAGYIYAPRFGRGVDELFLRTDPGCDDVYLNGEKLCKVHGKDEPKMITTGSIILRQLDLSLTRCKFRSFGTSLLHIASAAVFRSVDACIDPTCYVWDIAPAHAIVKRLGMDYQYFTGESFSYTDELLIERRKFPVPLVVGTEKGRAVLIERLKG